MSVKAFPFYSFFFLAKEKTINQTVNAICYRTHTHPELHNRVINRVKSALENFSARNSHPYLRNIIAFILQKSASTKVLIFQTTWKKFCKSLNDYMNISRWLKLWNNRRRNITKMTHNRRVGMYIFEKQSFNNVTMRSPLRGRVQKGRGNDTWPCALNRRSTFV